MGLSSSGRRVELEEGILESVVQLHDGSLEGIKLVERERSVITLRTDLVTTAVTVVWSREDCDDVPIMRPVVSLHH